MAITPLEISQELADEAAFILEQSKAEQHGEKCINRCPYIFYREATGTAHIVQGCCNDWTCPRCGHIRARQEYAKIVNGAKTLAEQAMPLYFWTLTCRGKELSLWEAEKGYLKWTDKLLTAARNKSKRAGMDWHYAQVTERQKRMHPHSHLIMSYVPPDVSGYGRGARLPNGRIAKHAVLWSDWLIKAVSRAGLGTECEISLIRSPAAVAVYVSKYLFKDAITTKWPKGWKRVRYSQSWPKLPERAMMDAFPLIRLADWKRMDNLGITVHTDSMETYYAALARLIMCVVPPIETSSH